MIYLLYFCVACSMMRSPQSLLTNALIPVGVYFYISDFWLLSIFTFLLLILVRISSVFSFQDISLLNNPECTCETSKVSLKSTWKKRPLTSYLPKIKFSQRPIKSTDSNVTRTRRLLLNQISVENFDLVMSKLLVTLDKNRDDFIEVWDLLFEAAQIQPEFFEIFVKVASEIDAYLSSSPESHSEGRSSLLKQCMTSWSCVCICSIPSNGSKHFNSLSTEDQSDLLSRHRLKRKAVTSLLGGLVVEGLVKWDRFENLLRSLICEQVTSEDTIELLCWFFRGCRHGCKNHQFDSYFLVLGAFKLKASRRIRYLIEEIETFR